MKHLLLKGNFLSKTIIVLLVFINLFQAFIIFKEKLMKELLEKLLNNDLLDESTKKNLWSRLERCFVSFDAG